MRILVLCYEYPPIGGGGGRVAEAIAEQLATRGHEVRVQTAGLGGRSSVVQRPGVRIYRTASGRRLPDRCTVPEMGLYVLTSFLPALRHCWQWKPDVIHAHFAMPSGVLAWAAHLATRIPYVLTAHLGDVPGGVPEQTDRLFRSIGWMARAVWQRAAGATAVSEFVRSLAERAYKKQVRRILNGIDLSGRPPRPSQMMEGPRSLAFVGRLNAQKNAPLLIEALAVLKDLRWRLTLVGDGDEMGRVRGQIQATGLADRVTLTGWRSVAEVDAILRQSDVLCIPSSSEGLPVAAVEGLKNGLAIAGTRIPGLRDVLRAGLNGIEARAGDPVEYAAGLRPLLEDPALLLCMRQASWDLAEEFALERIASEYEEVLAAARETKRPVT